MYRTALLIFAAALASGCGSASLTSAQGAPGHGDEPRAPQAIDERADRLTLAGRWSEARALVERGLADARARGDAVSEARLLLRRGHVVSDELRHRGGDRARPLADLEAAHALAERTGDAGLLAASLDSLGMHRFTGWFSTQDPVDLAAADEQFRAALVIRASRSDAAALSDSHFHVGLVHQMRGDDVGAQREFAESLRFAERAHDEPRMSYALRHLGYMAERRHDWAAAEDGYRRSLELRERAGAGPGVAAALVALAEFRYARDGAAGPALAMLARARMAAASASSLAYVSISAGATARVRRDQGEYGDAIGELTAAIAAMDAMKSDEDVPESYEQMALIHLLAGDPRSAADAAERSVARRPGPASPRLQALVALTHAAAARAPVPRAATDASDPVAAARGALAAGDAPAAFAAALRGDDPDTLLLAARALGAAGFERAQAAAAGMSKAQALRFAREARRGSPDGAHASASPANH